MTLRTRRKIFYTLVAIFFVLGSGVVGYAQGWRLDFTTWQFEKIGGIYVRSFPQDASLYLNGQPIQNTSGFLSPGTLISDLLPKTYSVSLKLAGYDDWQENAAVLPSEVVQFKYAVLVPTDGMPIPSSTPSGTIEQLSLAAASSSGVINPYGPAEKIILNMGAASTSSKISILDTTQATTSLTIVVPGKNLLVRWLTGNLIGILQTDGELYLYDTSQGNSSQALQKLADNVNNVSATTDGSMIATLERESLEVFSLNDPSVYYRFNLPNITAAKSVIWYKDKTHLFIVYPDHVSFLDLADANLINFTTVGQGTKPLYDPSNNILYMTTPAKTEVEYQFSN